MQGFYLSLFLLASVGIAGPIVEAIRPCEPKRLRRWRPAALMILAFCAVHALYWTDARMRAPLVPAVAAFAARGAKTLRRAEPARQNGGGS